MNTSSFAVGDTVYFKKPIVDDRPYTITSFCVDEINGETMACFDNGMDHLEVITKEPR